MAQNAVEILINLKKSGTGAKQADDELQGVQKTAKAVGTALAAMATIGTVKALHEFARLGAESIRTRNAFTAISGGADQASARLEAMQRATRGAISEQQAMAVASRLMQMGLASNAGELEKIAGMAVRLGSAMGKDAAGSIEEFAMMLANQSIPRLDTFGISSSKVRSRMEELRATTAGMTREAAFMAAVTEQGAAAMERLGPAVEDEALAFERLDAQIADSKAALAEQLAPAWADFLGLMNRGIEEAGGWGTRLKQFWGGLAAGALNMVGAKDSALGLLNSMGLLDQGIQYVTSTSRDAGAALDGAGAAMARNQAAADLAAGAQYNLATAAGTVATKFGEMKFDDETLWKMAAASGASLESLGQLAQILGIANQAEIESTVQAYKNVEAFAAGEMSAYDLAAGNTDLRLATEKATEAAKKEERANALLGRNLPEVARRTLGLARNTETLGTNMDTVNRMGIAVVDTLNSIPETITIHIRYETEGNPPVFPAGTGGGGTGGGGRRQWGGRTWGGAVWLGEGGPELAVLPRGTEVVPAWRTREVVRQSVDQRSWSRGGDTFVLQDPLAVAMVLEERRRSIDRRLSRGF